MSHNCQLHETICDPIQQKKLYAESDMQTIHYTPYKCFVSKGLALTYLFVF
jgi:hypothetical protein